MDLEINPVTRCLQIYLANPELCSKSIVRKSQNAHVVFFPFNP